GTGDAAPFLIGFGKLLSQSIVKLKGRKTRSNLVHTLVYGTLNNRVKNPRTDFDFITHDESVVDAYIADPRCGNQVTVEYAREMLSGIQFISKKNTFESVDKDLPILIVSGEDDPLAGSQRADFDKVVDGYKAAGIKNLAVKVYPGMRHEVLNEIGKETVYQDIRDFIVK
ncbi:MAG: alpha/beta hydrolase, partial [Eubacteriales bacterium]